MKGPVDFPINDFLCVQWDQSSCSLKFHQKSLTLFATHIPTVRLLEEGCKISLWKWKVFLYCDMSEQQGMHKLLALLRYHNEF